MNEVTLTVEEAERVAKLPVWAQDLIRRYARQHREDQEQVRKASEGDADSNTWIDSHGTYDDRPLENNAEISFRLGESKEKWRNTINVRVRRDEPDELEIVSYNGHPKRLAISPQSGNVVRVKLVPW